MANYTALGDLRAHFKVDQGLRGVREGRELPWTNWLSVCTEKRLLESTLSQASIFYDVAEACYPGKFNKLVDSASQ